MHYEYEYEYLYSVLEYAMRQAETKRWHENSLIFTVEEISNRIIADLDISIEWQWNRARCEPENDKPSKPFFRCGSY
jgi:hypothetical protein